MQFSLTGFGSPTAARPARSCYVSDLRCWVSLEKGDEVRMRDGEMHACLWMIILADLSVAKRSKRRNVAVSATGSAVGEDHTATVRMGLTLPGWLLSRITKTPVLDMPYSTDFPNEWHECTNTSVADSRTWGPIPRRALPHPESGSSPKPAMRGQFASPHEVRMHDGTLAVLASPPPQRNR